MDDFIKNEKWAEAENYISGLFIPADPALETALLDSAAAGLPPRSVSPNQGKLMQILAKALGARKILEIGTLGGYSAIWLARALPQGGKLVTLELDPKCADVARTNIVRAGLDAMVELRQGDALETLPKLQAENAGPFDLIFIDADQPNKPDYFLWALKLSRPGSLIIIDNVIWSGEVANKDSRDLRVKATRKLNALLAEEKKVSVTTMQTVGAKGYDGFAVVLVIS